MWPEPHASDTDAAAAAAAGLTQLESQPAVKIKSEPDESKGDAAAAALTSSAATDAAAAAEPASESAAAAEPAAPAFPPLSSAEYADRIADGLARMLHFTHHAAWRSEMLHELGVENTEQARAQIRALLEEVLQLHEPAPAPAANASDDQPSSLAAAAAAVKKQEPAFKLEGASSISSSINFAPAPHSTLLSSLPSAPPFSHGFAPPPSVPSFDSSASPPALHAGAGVGAGGGAFSAGPSLSQPMPLLHPSSVAPMSLCSFDGASPSPPPVHAAAPSAPAPFVPRVLPKRSAADLFK